MPGSIFVSISQFMIHLVIKLYLPEVIDILADFSAKATSSCDAYDVCKAVKSVAVKFDVDDVYIGHSDDATSKFLSGINCEEKFPECVSM